MPRIRVSLNTKDCQLGWLKIKNKNIYGNPRNKFKKGFKA